MTDFLEAVRRATDDARASRASGMNAAEERRKAAEAAEVEEVKRHYSVDFLKQKMMDAAGDGLARIELMIFEDCESSNPHWWPEVADHIQKLAKDLGVVSHKTENRHLRDSSRSSLAHCSGKISLYWGRPGQSAYGDD